MSKETRAYIILVSDENSEWEHFEEMLDDVVSQQCNGTGYAFYDSQEIREGVDDISHECERIDMIVSNLLAKISEDSDG